MKPERCSVDTNLFLRYLTNDIPEQADAVERLLRRAAAGEIGLVTNSLVLTEIVWVLESLYHLPRPAIREKILAILNTPGLDVPDSGLVFQAIMWYVEQNIDFIDAHNGAWMQERDIGRVYAFDQRHFARLMCIAAQTPEAE